MNKEAIKNKNIASGIAILMLLLAIPSGMWPYGYYVLLRWIITGIALFILSISAKPRLQYRLSLNINRRTFLVWATL